MGAKRYKYSYRRAMSMMDDGLLSKQALESGIEEGLIEPSPTEQRVRSLPGAIQFVARNLFEKAEQARTAAEKEGYTVTVQFRKKKDSEEE